MFRIDYTTDPRVKRQIAARLRRQLRQRLCARALFLAAALCGCSLAALVLLLVVCAALSEALEGWLLTYAAVLGYAALMFPLLGRYLRED